MVIYRLNAISMKFQWASLEKVTSWSYNSCGNAREQEQPKQPGGKKRAHSHILLSKLITQSYSQQDCDSGIRIRHTDQQNRTENSKINPSLHLRSTVFLFFLCPQCHMVCRILVLHTGIEPGSSESTESQPQDCQEIPWCQQIFYKGSRTIQQVKNSLQQIVLEQLNIHTQKSDPYLTPSAKIN